MIKKTNRKILFFTFVVLFSVVLFSPIVLFAQEGGTGLVPCENDCGFEEFMQLINKVVNFVLFQLAIPFSAIMFAYAGGLLLFSGGEISKRNQAKKIFTNVALGLIIAAGAWLIVHSVLSVLGYDGSWIGF